MNLEDACEFIDASIFTGCPTDENRRKLLRLVARWDRGLKEHEDQARNRQLTEVLQNIIVLHRMQADIKHIDEAIEIAEQVLENG